MPNPPKLLILAASTYQIPFIVAARRLGCHVLTVDNRPDNPGHRLADQAIDCDTTDTDRLVGIAREHRVDGVVAAATDVALDAAARIASELGLPGPTPACTRVLTRKIAFRQLQATLGLPTPPHSTSASPTPSFAGPWIIKPNRASGSKGIRIVDDPAGLEAAWRLAGSESVDGLALAEAFVDGRQGTLEGVLQDGRIRASMATDRITARPPAVGTRGHRVPADLPGELLRELDGQVERLFAGLEYRDGPFDADFVVDAQGRVFLLEVTPRAGGNSLVRLLQHACGFDMPSYVVQTALGRAPEVAPFTIRPTELEILSADRPGVVTYCDSELDAIRAMPGVCHLELDVPPGARARGFADGRDRLGELVVSADTAQTLDERLLQVRAALQLRCR